VVFRGFGKKMGIPDLFVWIVLRLEGEGILGNLAFWKKNSSQFGVDFEEKI
jgi:hypothetical protein